MNLYQTRKLHNKIINDPLFFVTNQIPTNKVGRLYSDNKNGIGYRYVINKKIIPTTLTPIKDLNTLEVP